jgi:hypothetical protein
MKVCICGTVKNVGEHLSRVLENMEKIATLFEDYIIILYYDHSEDNTLEILKNYREKNPKLIFYVNKSRLSSFRTHNIAKGRNFCLQKIRETYSDYEYMIMMDCDEVSISSIKVNLLKYYLNRSEFWDALSFNRKDYYDIWALSISPYIVSDRHFHKMLNVENIMKNYVINILDKVPKNKLVKCCSAFNGFSIYKIPIFMNCIYDGRLRLDLIPKNIIRKNEIILKDKIRKVFTNTGAENSVYEDCEHRSFHLQAIKEYNAKIRISPCLLFEE